MDRQREQTWLVIAGVLAAHGVVLVALAAYWLLRGVPVQGLGRSITVARAPIVARALPDVVRDENRLGEAEGNGQSIASVDLPTVATTDRPRDFEQAWTRRRPIFTTPSSAERTPGEASPTAAEAEALGPDTIRELRAVPVPVSVSTADAKPQAEAQATQTLERPQSPTSAELPDPAMRGQSDLDAFATDEGAAFSPGGIAARRGREVKLVRPRIELSFMTEATRLVGQELAVKMSIETDADGRPRRVDVIASSGSATIDDAVRLAMYDSWFGGKQPDRFPFTVRFVR